MAIDIEKSISSGFNVLIGSARTRLNKAIQRQDWSDAAMTEAYIDGLVSAREMVKVVMSLANATTKEEAQQ